MEWNILVKKIVLNIWLLLRNGRRTPTGSSGLWAPDWDQFLSMWQCLRCWQRSKHIGSSLYTFSAFPLPPYAWPPLLPHLRKSPPLGLQTKSEEQYSFMSGKSQWCCACYKKLFSWPDRQTNHWLFLTLSLGLFLCLWRLFAVTLWCLDLLLWAEDLRHFCLAVVKLL